MDWTTILMFVAIIAVFYFLLILPEKKKKKKLDEMRNGIAIGDSITTIGGLVGKVVFVTNENITFETSEDRVRIEVTRWAISTVDKKANQPAEAAESDK